MAGSSLKLPSALTTRLRTQGASRESSSARRSLERKLCPTGRAVGSSGANSQALSLRSASPSAADDFFVVSYLSKRNNGVGAIGEIGSIF